MNEPFDPGFDFDPDTVAWVAATTALLSAVAIFVFDRPAWMLPIGFVAGGVAALRGGFYDATANNGLLGVALTAPVLYLLAFVYRLGAIPTPGIERDLLFVTGVLSLADMIGYVPMMAIVGYVGGTVVDRVRRRFDPPVGYREGGSTRRLTDLDGD